MPDWKSEIRARLAPLHLEPAREAEMVEEMSQHLDDRFVELRAGGASEEELRRLVLEELSGGGLLEAELRRVERPRRQEPMVLSQSNGNMLENIYQDLRYAAADVAQKPRLHRVAVFTLALGTRRGIHHRFQLDRPCFVATAAFMAIPRAAGDDLPTQFGAGLSSGPWFQPQTSSIGAPQNTVFQDLAGEVLRILQFEAGAGKPEHVHAAYVTATITSPRCSGVRPVLGRTFASGEDFLAPDTRLAVLSYALWLRSVLERIQNIAGKKPSPSAKVVYTVVGVNASRISLLQSNRRDGAARPATCNLNYGWRRCPVHTGGTERIGRAFYFLWDWRVWKPGVTRLPKPKVKWT